MLFLFERLTLVALFVISVLGQLDNEALGAELPKVQEIAMAAPDIVRVEVREAPVHLGHIVKLPVPSVAARGTWTRVNEREWGLVVGAHSDHARTADTADILPLNRTVIEQVAGYGRVGNRTVMAVYRKSVPWSSGTQRGGAAIASFAHFIYLKLDGPLTAGHYTISWPGAALPPTPFEYNDLTTRSSSIRATQLGYRPDDVSKYAYLALWLPGGPDDGAVDFRNYDLKRFEIIDAQNKPVFSGSIDLRIGPRDEEAGSGVGGRLEYARADGTKFWANRAGTYVFGLDFSAWRCPGEGTYRIRIPGLGTSDPFVIAADVWYRAARTAIGGLYNQRSGTALDGRFGYTRPEAFTEKSGIVVRQSKLPLSFSKEGGGFIDFQQAAKAPWITDEIVPNVWGGYMDAGDWDRRVVHVKVSALLLDVYEQLPQAARAMSFGIPSSEQALPNSIYEGKHLPDLVNEAVWNLDFYRRMQRKDGAVRGGIDSANSPQAFEPSWLESQAVFAYAPDPEASFMYAAAAAKLAFVLRSLDEKTLADVYQRSAELAWNWAEQAIADPDIAYGEARRLLALSPDEYEKKLNPTYQRTKDARTWAAAALFRLSGESRFGQVAMSSLKEGIKYTILDAAWEYLNARQEGADRAIQDRARKAIIDFAATYIANYQKQNVAYRNMKHASTPMMWGEGLAPRLEEAAALIRAHRLTGDNRFLETMLDGSAHILGANQLGISFTIGLGYRWPTSPLHVDSIAAGTAPPAGLTVYGWSNPAAMTAYWSVWSAKWSALADKIPEKSVWPPRSSLPLYEYFIDYPKVVVSAEYTVQQTIGTTAAVWIYLDGASRLGQSCRQQGPPIR